LRRAREARGRPRPHSPTGCLPVSAAAKVADLWKRHPAAVRGAFRGNIAGTPARRIPIRLAAPGKMRDPHTFSVRVNLRAVLRERRDGSESGRRWATVRLKGQPSTRVAATGNWPSHWTSRTRASPPTWPSSSPRVSSASTHQRWTTRSAAVAEMPRRRIPGRFGHHHGKFPRRRRGGFGVKRGQRRCRRGETAIMVGRSIHERPFDSRGTSIPAPAGTPAAGEPSDPQAVPTSPAGGTGVHETGTAGSSRPSNSYPARRRRSSAEPALDAPGRQPRRATHGCSPPPSSPG
jgi:hypothetical protein